MFRLGRTALKVKQVTIYDVTPSVKQQHRKLIIKNALATRPKLVVFNKLNPYYKPYELVKQQQRNQITKYENSILWSPRFTPHKFKFMFLIPAICVALLLLYIRYIAHPKRMLQLKKEKGFRFKDLQKKGWLEGWQEKPDHVLNFQVWTLEDLDKLQKQGVFEQKKQNLNKKSKKFVTGNKQFVLADFKQK